MKKLLSLLLSFVLLNAQAMALSGGPTYASALNMNGTYSGVMTPVSKNRIFENPAVIASVESDANSLGIFVLNIPGVGAAVGSFLYFDEGEAFFGDINAVADPADGSIKGLLAGVALGNNRGTGIEFLTPLNAVGKIDAKVKASTNLGQGTRLSGEAIIQNQAYVPDTSPSGYGLGIQREITFIVDGFQQTLVASGASISAPSTTLPPVPTTP